MVWERTLSSNQLGFVFCYHTNEINFQHPQLFSMDYLLGFGKGFDGPIIAFNASMKYLGFVLKELKRRSKVDALNGFPSMAD